MILKSNCVFFELTAQFYGCSTWKIFKVTVMLRLEAAYVKCVKSFFGFERRYRVTQMFCDLGLPTYNTVIHNAQVGFDSSVDTHNNKLCQACISHLVIFYRLYVLISVCLFFYIHRFSTSFMGHYVA